MRWSAAHAIGCLSFVCVVLATASCGRSPEASSNGLCPLDCANPYIAGPKHVISSMDESIDLVCHGYDESTESSGKPKKPVRLTFLVTDSQGNPRKRVGFEPVIHGELEPDETDEENQDPDKSTATEIVPAKYIGIVTPRSQWCSDACGVATLEVWPKCYPSATEVSVRLHSGATKSDTVRIAVSPET